MTVNYPLSVVLQFRVNCKMTRRNKKNAELIFTRARREGDSGIHPGKSPPCLKSPTYHTKTTSVNQSLFHKYGLQYRRTQEAPSWSLGPLMKSGENVKNVFFLAAFHDEHGEDLINSSKDERNVKKKIPLLLFHSSKTTAEWEEVHEIPH